MYLENELKTKQNDREGEVKGKSWSKRKKMKIWGEWVP